MTLPRVFTVELGGSPLARAAYGENPPDWYRRRPTDAGAWREHAVAVAAEFPAGAWLEALRPAFAARGAAAERLERTARAGGVVVTTGQQPALFGGPAYNLSKALSVLALADVLEARTGVPVAPVFWAATDDADFDEARSVKVSLPGGAVTLSLTQQPPAGTPLANAPLEDVALLFNTLSDACGSAVNPEPLQYVQAAYAQGSTLGNAYLSVMRDILEPLGISVLDASHPCVRKSAAPVLRRALERAGAVESAQEQRADEIAAAGFTPQVEHVAGLSLVFSTHDGERRRIPIGEAGKAVTEIPVTTLGPNVLLRPVVERAILPTVTYVGGPGETAYFAQVSAVAAALECAVPIVSPRWSMTLLEPRIEKILDALGIEAEALANGHAVEGSIARQAVPPEISAAIAQLRANVESGAGELASADHDHLIPGASVEGFHRWMLYRIERLERRYLAGVKRRNGDVMRDIATARGALYPGGVRQERALSFIPWLARYGSALVDEMREQAAVHALAIVGGAEARTVAAAPTSRSG